MCKEITGMAIFSKTDRYLRGVASPLAALVAGILGCYMIGCTKPDDPFTPRVDTLPTPVGPTGNIKEFSVQDSLVGYGRQTILKWNVTETNSKTMVTLNGIKVALYGGLQSGQLYNQTTFTLAVNSGKTATKLIRVADSLTTRLWNDGQRWMPVDILKDTSRIIVGSQGQDSTVYYEISIFDRNADRYRNERLSFYLDRTSKEEQLSSSYPKPLPSGKFDPYARVNPTDSLFMIWKNRWYWIQGITDNELMLRFDTLRAPGVTATTWIRYIPQY